MVNRRQGPSEELTTQATCRRLWSRRGTASDHRPNHQVYSSSPSKGVWLGWISSVASAGRCVGPLWAVALYDMGFQSSGGDSGSGDVSSGVAAPSTATAEAAAAPVWLINGGGSLLAAAIVLLAWRAMEPAQPRERS